MTSYSFRFTLNIYGKCEKILLEPQQIQVKWDLEASQNDNQKNDKKKDKQNQEKSEFGVLTGSLGGVARSVFDSFASPDAPWSRNGHKTSHKNLWDPRAFIIFDFNSLLDSRFE